MNIQNALTGDDDRGTCMTPLQDTTPQASWTISLRSKLAILVLVATVASSLTVGTVMWRTASSLFLQQAHSNLDKKNQSIATELDTLAERASSAMQLTRRDSAFARYFESIAHSPQGDPAALADVTNTLKTLHSMFNIAEACVIDVHGVERAREVDGLLATATELSPDESEQEFVAATLGLREGQIYRSRLPYRSEDTQQWALAHATPISLDGGPPVGMLHFEIPFQWFADKVRAVTRDGSYSFLLTRAGQLLIAPPNLVKHAELAATTAQSTQQAFKSATDYGNDSFSALTTRMVTEKSGSGTFVDSTGEQQEVIFKPVYDGDWVLATALPQALIFRPSLDLLRDTAFTATPVVILALAMMLWIAARVVGPLQLMTRLLHSIAQGHVGHDVPRLPRDEIGAMGNAMREMIDYHRDMAQAATLIATGNLTQTIIPRTAQDKLGHAFVRMSASLREMLTAIQSAEARFRSIVQNAHDAIVLIDEAGSISFASPSIADLTGYTPEQITGRRIAALVIHEDEPLLHGALSKCAANDDDDTKVELRFTHADGNIHHCEVVLNNRLADSAVKSIVATCHDISERKAFEEQLTQIAFHDALTGLPNRALLHDRLENAMARAQRDQHQVAAIFIDLDNFKVVNDSLGHAAGDALLKEVAARLLTTIRISDTVARLGGDEFVVMLDPCETAGSANEVAERIIAVLKSPTDIEGHSIVALASIGVAFNSEHGMRASDVLRNADTAMYHAKANGKSRYVVFDQTMNDSANERLRLEGDLRVAIERGELELYYQPIVDLDSGQMREVEALLRWHHAEYGLIGPAKFIPIAEESGLIIQIGAWVLRDGCRQLAIWQKEMGSRSELGLSINLSTRQFQDPALFDDIQQALAEFDIDPQCLKLEITESMMMRDTDKAVETLHRLKRLGVKIAIDDFGTGYSSLAYLKSLPIDVLKIDRAFVTNLRSDGPDNAIVRSIIALAKSLDLAVTAEGIETAAQEGELKALECSNGQGYLFSKPVPQAEISVFLATRQIAAAAAVHDRKVVCAKGMIELVS